MDSDWARDLLGKKKHDGGTCQTRQTLAETHVVFANACCDLKWRSRVPRLDSSSVYKFGNAFTLPSFDRLTSAATAQQKHPNKVVFDLRSFVGLIQAGIQALVFKFRVFHIESLSYTHEGSAGLDTRVGQGIPDTWSCCDCPTSVRLSLKALPTPFGHPR